MKKNNIREFIDKYQQWAPPKIFLLFIVIITVLFVSLTNFVIDNDFWFIINLGEEIMNNGIPTMETFTIHSGLEFMAQQWLIDVVFYNIYHFGGVYGMYIFMLLSSFLIVFLIYKMSILVSGKRIKLSFFLTFIIYLILSFSFINTRPYVFDIIFFLLELYILELFIIKDNKRYLIILPLISFFMINLHSSVWLMLFVLLLPYYVEFIFKYKKNKLKFKQLFLVTIIMFLVGFINPYGADSIKYLFNSYGISYINEFVTEMRAVTVTNGLFYFGYIFLMLLSFYYNKSNNKIRYILLMLGTCYLCLSHFRGFLFLVISSILFFSYNIMELFKIEDCVNLYYKDKKNNILIMVMIFLGLTSYGLYFINVDFEDKGKSKLYEIANYLDENASKDIKLYTGYNDGPYLEYRGYKCYLDTRAEVFFKSNNKKSDIFIEYFRLQKGLYDTDKFLEKYNFDYLVVNSYDLLFYNLNIDEYDVVYETKIKKVKYKIFKRINDY